MNHTLCQLSYFAFHTQAQINPPGCSSTPIGEPPLRGYWSTLVPPAKRGFTFGIFDPVSQYMHFIECPEMDLNHRPIDFQSIASTAELSGLSDAQR